MLRRKSSWPTDFDVAVRGVVEEKVGDLPSPMKNNLRGAKARLSDAE
jgi:hypothetical protein